MTTLASAKTVDVIGATVTLRQGWTRFNTHYHDHDAATLTNRQGSSTAVGAALAYSTADDVSAVADNTLGSPRAVAIAHTVITNTSAGEFARRGVCTVSVLGTVTRGHYLQKGTGAGLVDTGVSVAGGYTPDNAIAIALESSSGATTIPAYVLPTTMHHGRSPRVLLNDTTAREYGASVPAPVADYTKYINLTIPGGTLGTDRCLRFRVVFGFKNNTGATRNFDVIFEYGTAGDFTSLFGRTTFVANTNDTLIRPIIIEGFLCAADATDAQNGVVRAHYGLVDMNGTSGETSGNNSVSGSNTLATDSTVDQPFILAPQTGMNSGEIVYLYSALVELVSPV